MPHMVIFRSVEGKPGYHQAETLDDAVRFVERLRNQEQIPEMRIFRMQEVPIEFKPYYRVEIMGTGEEPTAAGGPSAAGLVAPVADPDEKPDTAAPQAPVASEPVLSNQNGGSARFGRFNRT
ncbi:MAG TPA: hypothetical protein VF954_08075 [Acidimicrobiales bacterium]